jgi:hypothetical protein
MWTSLAGFGRPVCVNQQNITLPPFDPRDVPDRSGTTNQTTSGSLALLSYKRLRCIPLLTAIHSPRRPSRGRPWRLRQLLAPGLTHPLTVLASPKSIVCAR